MNIIKRHKNNNFVVLDKTALNDPNLSWQAKGLHSYLMGLPTEWEVNVRDLTNRSTNGKDSTRAVMNELINAGYVTRQRVTDKGKFTGYDYSIYETPQTEKPNTEKPNTEKPNTEKPNTEKPNTEKPQQISIDLVSIDLVSIEKSERPHENLPEHEGDQTRTNKKENELPQKDLSRVVLDNANNINTEDFVYFYDAFDPEQNDSILEWLQKSEYKNQNLCPQRIFDYINSNDRHKGRKKYYQWKSTIGAALGFKRNDNKLKEFFGKNINQQANEQTDFATRITNALAAQAERDANNPLFN